jgi:biopolymer transport protein ExbD
MAEIITSGHGDSHKRKIHSLKVDMTPMVDLGFLLITFFIFTSSMAEPKGMQLHMPADGNITNYGESATLTVLLGADHKIYYYEGLWQEAVQKSRIHSTTYHVQYGLGKIIRDKQKKLGIRKEELMLLIKPGDSSTYADMINTLDEIEINALNRYAIATPDSQEKIYLEKKSSGS